VVHVAVSADVLNWKMIEEEELKLKRTLLKENPNGLKTKQVIKVAQERQRIIKEITDDLKKEKEEEHKHLEAQLVRSRACEPLLCANRSLSAVSLQSSIAVPEAVRPLTEAQLPSSGLQTDAENMLELAQEWLDKKQGPEDASARRTSHFSAGSSRAKTLTVRTIRTLCNAWLIMMWHPRSARRLLPPERAAPPCSRSRRAVARRRAHTRTTTWTRSCRRCPRVPVRAMTWATVP
jgi:hypothetical protein